MLGIHKKKVWSIASISAAVGLSTGEVHAGWKRSRLAGLMREDDRKKNKDSSLYEVYSPGFHEFLVHGLRYAFAAEIGPLRRGIPTAHSVQPLVSRIAATTSDNLVWPHPEGALKGSSIVPLYKTFPEAALKNQQFHEALALTDALRIGRARERELAAGFLAERLGLKD